MWALPQLNLFETELYGVTKIRSMSTVSFDFDEWLSTLQFLEETVDKLKVARIIWIRYYCYHSTMSRH